MANFNIRKLPKGIKVIPYPKEDIIQEFTSKDYTGTIKLDNVDGKFKFDPDLEVPISGGLAADVTQEAHGFSVLTPVYHNGTQFFAASSAAEDTLGLWVIVQTVNNDIFTIAQAGRFEIPAHGLMPGQYYYVGLVAGTLVSTEPTSFSNPILFVESDTVVHVLPYRPSSPNSGGNSGLSSTDDLPEGVTNLYYTEARVSANPDVAANTAKVSFPEAAIDGNAYARQDAAWVEVVDPQADMRKSVYDSGNKQANVYSRVNHEGTQLASTISDFEAAVTANTFVTGSIHAHDDVDILSNIPVNGQTLKWDNGKFIPSDQGAGDMLKDVYDPQGIEADAFDRANHTGTQDISTITGLDTNTLDVDDPVIESTSGTAVTQKEINEETTDNIFALRDVIRQLSGASAAIEGANTPWLLPAGENIFDFQVRLPSTDDDVIEVNEVGNTITLKIAGTYQFATFLDIVNNPPAVTKDVVLRTRNNDTNAVITERTINVPVSGYTSTDTLLFDVDEVDVPLTIRYSIEPSVGNELQIDDVKSHIIIGGTYTTLSGSVSIAEPTIAAIRAITVYTDRADIFNSSNGFLYQFDEAEVAPDDSENYLTPDDITEPDPGRWVKIQEFTIGGAKWRNIWAPGLYSANDMAIDNGWLGIANKDTTARLAPEESTFPTWKLPDEPTWSDITKPTRSYSGINFRLSGVAKIDGYRVWIPEVGTNVRHSIFLYDVTNTPDKNPTASTSVLISSTFLYDVNKTGWLTLNIPARLFNKDTDFTLIVQTIKYSNTTTNNSTWENRGTETITDGSIGHIGNNADRTELYIHEQDNSSVLQSSWLDTITEGDDIRVAKDGDNTKYDLYNVTSSSKTSQVYTFGVNRIDSGGEVKVGEGSVVTATVYNTIANSPYVELTNYWLDNSPENAIVKGFSTETFADIITPNFDDNAYGIDLFGSLIEFSDDWDLMSYSSGSTGSGSGGGTASPIRPIDTDIIFLNGVTEVIGLDDTVKTYDILNGTTAQGFTLTGLEATEEHTAKRIIDNTGNASAVTVTWPSEFIWDDSGVPTSFAALSKYILEVEGQSGTEAFAMLIPLA